MLPFKYGGADASLTTLAEGLTEEIVTGLSRFSYLRVISPRVAADAQSAGKSSALRPDFAATARADIEKWWDPEYWSA